MNMDDVTEGGENSDDCVPCLISAALGISSHFCEMVIPAGECKVWYDQVVNGDITLKEFFGKVESVVTDDGALTSIRNAKEELRKVGVIE